MKKKLFIFAQYTLPHHLLSRIMGYAAACRWKWLKNVMISRFIQRYHVDLEVAALSRLEDYPSFNAFFTRALKDNMRPIAPEAEAIVSPIDGCISQIGRIEKSSLLQAKGAYFTVDTLLGGSPHDFYDGQFVTFYLSPKDYHRVHMPLEGKLRKTIYVPGKLFSVNALSTKHIPHLFSRNERLLCFFDTPAGMMTVIFIGAMMVGKIETVWGLQERSSRIVTRYYSDQKGPVLPKGAELGRFNMGSSVILLFGKNRMTWSKELDAQSIVQVGQIIGTIA